MQALNKIVDFLLCLLRSNCEYSLKKWLAYWFTGLIFYLAIFQQNISTDLLLFLAALLGMREFSKKYPNQNNREDNKDVNINKE